MSRLADAFRRSAAHVPTSRRRAPGHEDVGRLLATDLPWDLGDADQSDRQGRSVKLPWPTIAHREPSDGSDVAALHDLMPLVQRLLPADDSRKPVRSVLFTSVEGAGMSGRVCALAGRELSLHTTDPVCVVDCNLQASSLREAFDTEQTRGLSDLLLEPLDLRDCLTQAAPNLWLLPCGRRCREISTPIGLERVVAHVRHCQTLFEYVLIDAPPAHSHPGDIALLGAALDGVVLVLDAESTRRAQARRTLEQLRAAEVMVLGAVLTNRRFPIPERLYRKL